MGIHKEFVHMFTLVIIVIVCMNFFLKDLIN